jgi:hypothetical protein
MVDTVSPTPAANADEKRTFAAAGFPFFDFDDSLQVPKLVMSRGGGVAELDPLAAWLGYSTSNSGTFASKLASARYFGLIGPAKGGKVYLTERARQIVGPVMPEDAVKAKMEAFLEVPLFRRVFDRVRGATLPADVGLRNLFTHEFQVPVSKAPHAVRVFKESAKQTGFFDSAPDRLIKPSLAASRNAVPDTLAAPLTDRDDAVVPPAPVERRRGGGDGSGVHPAIIGILRELPPPGTAWTTSDQQRFLDAFTAMVKFIYPAKSEADGA